jgi:hypothetical protein
LRERFLRETGWMLEVDRYGARLFKRPADLASAVRGLDGYDRRRYVLLCLACARLALDLGRHGTAARARSRLPVPAVVSRA